MRTIVQAEAAECGMACLAMVASHHGHRVTLRELRERFPMSLKGTSLAQLMLIARDLGFQSRALRLELDDLRALKLPCILHWNLDHFVVLANVGSRFATIHDPGRGKCKLSYAEVSRHFTGIAVELSVSENFRTKTAVPAITIPQLTGTIRGLGRSLVQIIAASLALQIFVVLAPFLLQWVVDQVLVSADRDLLVVLGIGFGLALLLQVAIGLVRGWAVIYLSSQLATQWAGNLFAHLLRLPNSFFEKRHIGDITSRLDSIQTIQRTLTTSFLEAMIDGVMAIVTLLLMLAYSVKLATITLAVAAVYLTLRLSCFRPLRDRTEQQLIAGARQESHMLETVRGIQSVKVAGQEGTRQSQYLNLLTESVNQGIRISRFNLGFNSANQLIFGIERLAVIWIGALLVLDGVFSVGMLIAYLAYKDQFATRVAALIDKGIEFRMLRLHGERIADIALSKPDEDEASNRELISVPRARMAVHGLSFRYADGEPWVLNDCSFEVEEGESIAIVGPSGCGKTTLLKLLLGLLHSTEGRVLLDGRDIRSIGFRNYRNFVGAVMQDDQLFAGSIASNIAFGDSSVDISRVVDSAKLAAVHDEITALPMGYHSLIGDMGSVLSGGQKQRVILARALYRKPRLLFLDEATSHLDLDRERLVNEAIHRLSITKIIVAHRPETISSSDRVLKLESGRIVNGYEQRTIA